MRFYEFMQVVFEIYLKNRDPKEVYQEICA